ncbi:uncharacterized protein LOC115885341 [Sitophilus oryzae]|uniref:Uncharacterized protein LOC115885341 n=1 Tax=Sitophilus oryzae TaxID=7048 RepID=A0A6J2YA47_SITOR|nr:uncharacterized protein LOC115885341 [Sitophilus oryzae]XP_030760080.1 uncharacterized protein LOC115885341 [Sitophilus oryzae]
MFFDKNMEDSFTERLLQSLKRANEGILKASEQTILSSKMKDLPNSVKSEWLDEEKLLKEFREAVQELKIDEKHDALKKIRNVKDICVKRKSHLETKYEKIDNKVAVLQSEIPESLEQLESNLSAHDFNEEIEILT